MTCERQKSEWAQERMGGEGLDSENCMYMLIDPSGSGDEEFF